MQNHTATRKNKTISINLFDDHVEGQIKYSSKSGEIGHTDTQWTEEMNAVLNLNHHRLQQNRKQALEGLIQILKASSFTHAAIRKYWKIATTPNANRQLPEYCGILRRYLRKKLPNSTTNH